LGKRESELKGMMGCVSKNRDMSSVCMYVCMYIGIFTYLYVCMYIIYGYVCNVVCEYMYVRRE